MIKVEDLTKYYGSLCAVDHISFEIRKGEILGLLGPNGAGKSTTLRILTCFFQPTSGKKNLHILRATARAEVDPDQAQAEVKEENAGEGTLHWETLEGKPVQEKEIDSLVKTLSNLKCDGYLEDKKDDLGDPTFSVSLKGNKNYEFSLYGERDGKTLATSSENDDPFLIADWNAKRIRKELDALVEIKD